MLVGVIAEELLNGLGVSSGGVDAVLDLDVFPSATIRVPGFLLLEGQFDEGDNIYPAYIGDVADSIFPPPVVDPDTVYAFTKAQIVALSPSLFRDDLTDTFRSPNVLSKVLGPSLFVDPDIFGGARKITEGKATINQQYTIDNVVDIDVIFGPLVEQAGLVIIPGKTVLSDGDAVNLSTTTVRAVRGGGNVHDTGPSTTPPPLGYLLPNLVAADDGFVAPDARRPIAPGLFTDVDIFFAPTRLNYLAPTAVLDSDVFFVPSTPRQLQPATVADSDVFIGPAFTQPGLFPLFIDPGEFISSPSVTSIRFQPAPFTDGDVLYAPVGSQGFAPPYDPTLGAETFYGPTIGSAFSPASLTGLIGWWDASVTASLNLTGSSINSVADQSGLGNTMNWVNAHPTYNATGFNSSYPAIVLASGSTLKAASFPMGTGNTLTMWAVSTMAASGSQQYGRYFSYNTGANDYDNAACWLFSQNSFSTTQCTFFRNSTLAQSSSVTASPAPHRLIATVTSTGVMTVYIDGVSVGTNTAGGNWANGGNLQIGNDRTFTSGLVAPIAECGVATGYSDATTVGLLDTYLKNKWGL